MLPAHRFQELADHAPVLIWRVRPDMRCDYVNAPRLAFTGRSLREEMDDRYAAIHPEDVERSRTHFAAAFERRCEFKVDYRLRRHDGVYRWMMDTGRAFFDQDGAFGGYMGSCIDITDRKEAEVRAAKALSEARRAVRQRDVLLAEVHHRVKNNLQVILSLIALKARDADDGCRDALGSIGRRVQAIGVIQQELHEDADVSSIGLRDYITRLMRPLMMIHHGERATLAVEGEDARIDIASATLVGMILAELTANAFDHAFSNGSGALRIGIDRTPLGRLSVSLNDSGPGLDPDPAHKGGIGLKLVRNLARQGHIDLSNDAGPGARWTLVLPTDLPMSET